VAVPPQAPKKVRENRLIAAKAQAAHIAAQLQTLRFAKALAAVGLAAGMR
jgi:hypothetical protein